MDDEIKYQVDGWNNFCRVFELPKRFSSEYCFGGGIPTNFQMIDWFNPVPDIGQPTVSKEVWKEKVGEIKITTISHEEVCDLLIPWLQTKLYVKQGLIYLVICDFGACFTFSKKEKKDG